MSGSTPDLVRVAVIGGGLAGLTATYEVIRRTRIDFLPLEIRLYEAEDRLGGAIRSEQRDGFLIEHGPESFSTVADGALRLVVELGLRRELIPAHVERGASIWWKGDRHAMPPGLSLANGHGSGRRALLRNKLLGARGRLRAALEPAVPARRRKTHETVAGFVTRRFGRQMLERVAEPMASAALLGDADELDMSYAFPELVELERRHGSVSAGLRHLHDPDAHRFGLPMKAVRSPRASFRQGMQVLVDALATAVRRSDTDALLCGHRVERISPAGDPLGAAAYAVHTEDGASWTADICVLALPARVTSRLLRSFAPEVADGLEAIPHASSLAVHLGYGRTGAAGLPEQTACLVPRSQGRTAVSCALVHREFDYRTPAGAALVRVSMGGPRNPALIDWDDDTATRVARTEVAELLGVDAEPALVRVVRRPRGHPQHLVDHDARMRAIEHELGFHSGLLLAGSAIHGASVAHVIEGGRAVAATVTDVARTRLA